MIDREENKERSKYKAPIAIGVGAGIGALLGGKLNASLIKKLPSTLDKAEKSMEIRNANLAGAMLGGTTGMSLVNTKDAEPQEKSKEGTIKRKIEDLLDTAPAKVMIGAGVGGVMAKTISPGAYNIAGKAFEISNDKYKKTITNSNLNKYIDDLVALKNAAGFKDSIKLRDVDAFTFPTKDTLNKLEKHNIKINENMFDIKEMLRGPRYAYHPTDKTKRRAYIDLGNKYTTAHEIGHATGSNVLLTGRLPNALRPLGKYNFIALPAAGAAYDTNKKLSEQSLVTKAALGAAALTTTGAAVTLGEEARASIRGARLLKKLKQGTYRDAAKVLLPAFATYAVPSALIPYAGYKVVSQLGSRNGNSNDKKSRD